MSTATAPGLTRDQILALVDVPGITRALDRAKDQMEAAIRREMRRGTRRAGRGQATRLRVTQGMTDPLVALHAAGGRQAEREVMDLIGYARARGALADADPPDLRVLPQGVQGLVVEIDGLLVDLGKRIDDELDLAAEAAGVTRQTIAETLQRIPGARNIASQMVSRGFFGGMRDPFTENADLFRGFQQTAILDPNTCEPCRGAEGTMYDTLDDAAAAGMGNGGVGPYASCQGGDRCRCRVVPVPR